MENSTLKKLGGLSISAGGVLLALYATLYNALLPVGMMISDYSQLVSNPAWVPICVVALVGTGLLALGVVATYAVIARTAGVIGFIGFVFLFIAYLLQFGELVTEVFYYPGLASTEAGLEIFRSRSMVTHPSVLSFYHVLVATIGVGILLFGISLLRSKAFPKAAGILLIVGAGIYAAAPSFFVDLAGITIFAVACVMIGIATRKAA